MVRQTKPGNTKPVKKAKRINNPIDKKPLRTTLPVDPAFPLSTDETFNGLTTIQKQFVYHYYLKPVTRWTNAKIYRYISPGTSATSASALVAHHLAKPEVKYCVNKLAKIYNDSLGITTDRILNELAGIAYSDITEFFVERDDGRITCQINPKELPPHARRAIKSFKEMWTADGISYEVTLWDKMGAIKQLREIKNIGTTQKMEVSGPDGMPIQHNHMHKIDLTLLSNKEIDSLLEISNKINNKTKTNDENSED